VPAGCREALKSFLDHLSQREREGQNARNAADAGAATLTTMHAAKGREWDAVFAVGCHDGGIPLLSSSSFNSNANLNAAQSAAAAAAAEAELAEERRLFYVCLTRARTEVTISYAALRDGGAGRNAPSRFLRELPPSCIAWTQSLAAPAGVISAAGAASGTGAGSGPSVAPLSDADVLAAAAAALQPALPAFSLALPPPPDFLQRHFRVEQRPAVSALFHHWAKSAAFRDPPRLVSKIGFVLAQGGAGAGANAGAAHREALAHLRTLLSTPECLAFAAHVAAIEALPADERALMAAARQEAWQKAGGARKMAEAPPSAAQISYLRCVTSAHAS
jgi:hypothetical protein